MSVKTWKKEFYPTGSDTKKVQHSDKTRIKHCLVKWNGLLPENLKKHDVKMNWIKDLVDDDGKIFRIDASTCALCAEHMAEFGCGNCPLAETTGATCGASRTPWDRFMNTSNPQPMIKALEKTLKRCEKLETAK